MRRGISVALVLFGLAVLITGIEKLFPPFNEMTFVQHIINSFIFSVLAAVHIWLNWKNLMRYFRGLGRWWSLVGLGFTLVIGSSIVMPILMAGDTVS